MVHEQVLGGQWKGGVAVGAEEEQQRVGEGIKWEVGPVFQGRPWLEPWEGKATAGIPSAQDPMVRGVPMEGGGPHRRREPCGRGVNFGGGAHDPQARQMVFVREEESERREAGLDSQDVRGGRHEAVGRPPLDLVPEHRKLPRHVDGGQEGVGAVAENGEEEGGGYLMTKEGGEADSWWGEAFDRHQGRLGLGESLDEVGGSGDRGGEPVAQPPDLCLGCENRPIQVDPSFGDGVPIPVRTPVDELCFGN